METGTKFITAYEFEDTDEKGQQRLTPAGSIAVVTGQEEPALDRGLTYGFHVPSTGATGYFMKAEVESFVDSTAEEHVEYCALHCRTERALFNGKHINQMIELAGFPDQHPKSVDPNVWLSLHDDMEELVKLARENLK